MGIAVRFQQERALTPGRRAVVDVKCIASFEDVLANGHVQRRGGTARGCPIHSTSCQASMTTQNSCLTLAVKKDLL